MKHFIRICLILFASSCFAGEAPVEDVSKIISAPFEIEITSLETSDTYPAYVGGGVDISAPSGIPGGGMSMYIMIKGDDDVVHEYFAGEVSAPDERILVIVRCQVKNISQKEEQFCLGDITLNVDNSKQDFLAIGRGSYAFAKNEDELEKVRISNITIEPDWPAHLIYIFSVPIDSDVWQLTYKRLKSVIKLIVE